MKERTIKIQKNVVNLSWEGFKNSINEGIKF